MVRSDKPICLPPNSKKNLPPHSPKFLPLHLPYSLSPKKLFATPPEIIFTYPTSQKYFAIPPKIFCNTTSQNVLHPHQHTGVVAFFALLLSIHQLSSFLQNKNFKQQLNILSSLQCTAINSFRQAVSLPLTQ